MQQLRTPAMGRQTEIPREYIVDMMFRFLPPREPKNLLLFLSRLFIINVFFRFSFDFTIRSLHIIAVSSQNLDCIITVINVIIKISEKLIIGEIN